MTDRPLMLVAEDDPDDQYFMQEALAVVTPEPNPVETHYLWDGAQLLRTLREKLEQGYGRSLVVLDLHMRGMDGRTALREIKRDPALAQVAVAILTTSTNEEDEAYCRALGAAAYYSKPSSIVDLVEIMRQLYEGYLS